MPLSLFFLCLVIVVFDGDNNRSAGHKAHKFMTNLYNSPLNIGLSVL